MNQLLAIVYLAILSIFMTQQWYVSQSFSSAAVISSETFNYVTMISYALLWLVASTFYRRPHQYFVILVGLLFLLCVYYNRNDLLFLLMLFVMVIGSYDKYNLTNSLLLTVLYIFGGMLIYVAHEQKSAHHQGYFMILICLYLYVRNAKGLK